MLKDQVWKIIFFFLAKRRNKMFPTFPGW